MSSPDLIVAWVNAIASLLWPASILTIALIFQKSVREWLKTAHRVSVGPIELEREIERIAQTSEQVAQSSKKLLADTSKLQLLLAESRAIETEVFLSYPLLSESQRDQMQGNLDKLHSEIKKLREA